MYGRIVTGRLRNETEEMTGEEQLSFRHGKQCVSQILAIQQISEKAYEKGNQLYLCFIDLDEAYDIGD